MAEIRREASPTPEAGGTVTLVFTDIEGSTRLLQALGPLYAAVLDDHHRLLREAFAAHGGVEQGSAGDGLFFTFPTARGAVAAAVEGQRAVAAHPWPEGAMVRDRMGLHAGEPVDAGRGYVGLDVHRAARICAAGHGGQILISETTRGLAADGLRPPMGVVDLGIHHLKDLDAPERLYQVVGPGLLRDFPPPRTTEAPRNNLELEVTSFIGRERELEQAQAMLADASTVTLTGPGGVGKSRIAHRLARQALDRFEDGVWIAELGALSDPALVQPTVASILGVTEPIGHTLLGALTDHLRSRRMLLVLDDCDHVLSACAALAEAFARSCPGLRVVATSRQPLGVPGEAVLPIDSLAPPALSGPVNLQALGANDACRLFVERARSVQPAFEVTERNARAVIQICRRLDGIPLALELAAARVRALPVEQIAARLDDRFRLLSSSGRTAVARHQTLRATMDWSYDLLDETERAVLRRLAVFAGGASLEAAESVGGGDSIDPLEVFDILSRLVDRSLVMADATSPEARFRLLETVREYAWTRLVEAGEAEEASRRHRDWYLALVDEASQAFFAGPEPREWLLRLDAEHDDLRAALTWSLATAGEGQASLRMAAGLWRFWEIRGHLTEGRAWLERGVAAVGDEVSSLRANALTGAGSLAFMQGDFRAASGFHEESLALHRRMGDRHSIGYAANNLANTALQLGDLARARSLYEQTISLVRDLGDARGTAFGTINLADAVARGDGIEAARPLYEEALQMIRRLGDRWMEAFALDNFAVAVGRSGARDEARSLHVEALAILEELGDQRGVARLVTHLADLAMADADVERAAGLLRQALAIRQGLGDMPGLASAMESLAGAIAVNDPEAATRLHGAAESLREAIRATVPPQAAAAHDQRVAELAARLGSETFDAMRRQGRSMSPNEALATIPR